MKKIILSFLLCLGVQQQAHSMMSLIISEAIKEVGKTSAYAAIKETANQSTQIAVQEFAKIPLKTKAGAGAFIVLGGAAYLLYKYPKARKSIGRGIRQLGRTSLEIGSWAWKSRTALAMSAGSLFLTQKSLVFAAGASELVMPLWPLPVLTLGVWTIKEGRRWKTYRDLALSPESERTKWEQELRTISLPTNGYQISDSKLLLDARREILEDQRNSRKIDDYQMFSRALAAQLKAKVYLYTGVFHTHDVIQLLEERLKERKRVIKDLDVSTGLIHFISEAIGSENNFDTIVNELEVLTENCAGEECYMFEALEKEVSKYYKDSSNLSRFIHIRSFPCIEGFSWNKKVDAQWALIKEYAYLNLFKRIVINYL